MGRVLKDIRRVFGPRQRMKECTDELAESTAIPKPSTRQNPFTSPVTDAITITPTPSARNYDSMGVSRNPEDLLKTNETEWTVEQIVARIAELEAIEQYSTPQFPYMTERMTKYHAMVPKDGLSVSEVLKQKEQAEQLRTREEELVQFLQELEKIRKQMSERHRSRREQREKLQRVLEESGEFYSESNEFMAQLRKEGTECPKAEEAEINAHLLMEAGIRAQIIENQVRRKKLWPPPRRRQVQRRRFKDEPIEIVNDI